MATQDFSQKPIIIIGAGLSGTRLLVQMLQTLGSQAGDIDNIWKEESLFLSIHKELVNKMTGGRNWTSSIFDTSLVKSYKDDLQYVDYIRERLDKELDAHIPDRATGPWHWKCPPVYFFMDTWLKIYPEAYFVYVHRDPRQTGMSQMTRQQFLNPYSCLRFLDEVRNRLDSYRPRMKHCLDLEFEKLPKQVQLLADYLPMECTQENIQRAKELFRPKSRKMWEPQDSWRKNIWMAYCQWSLEAIYRMGLAGSK